MASKIKIGIVGIGRIGWPSATGEIAKYPEKHEIVAACDLLPDRTKKMNEAFGCAEYADYDEFLKNPDIELVYIATRSVDHYAHAMKALAAGKHDLLEKKVDLPPATQIFTRKV